MEAGCKTRTRKGYDTAAGAKYTSNATIATAFAAGSTSDLLQCTLFQKKS
jgi:hypothetical protein